MPTMMRVNVDGKVGDSVSVQRRYVIDELGRSWRDPEEVYRRVHSYSRKKIRFVSTSKVDVTDSEGLPVDDVGLLLGNRVYARMVTNETEVGQMCRVNRLSLSSVASVKESSPFPFEKQDRSRKYRKSTRVSRVDRLFGVPEQINGQQAGLGGPG